MRSLIISAILFLLSCFCTESIEGQTTQKMSYVLLNEGKIRPAGELEAKYGQPDSHGLYVTTNLTPLRASITGKTNSLFISEGRNCNDLIIEPILFNSIPAKSTGKASSMAEYENYATFSGKWERLTGKPIFDSSRVYNSPLKRSVNSASTYSHFYRATANIFNFAMESKYPSLSAPK